MTAYLILQINVLTSKAMPSQVAAPTEMVTAYWTQKINVLMKKDMPTSEVVSAKKAVMAKAKHL